MLTTRLASQQQQQQQQQQQLSALVAAKSATQSRHQLYRQRLGPDILAGSTPRVRHLHSESPPMSPVCAAATPARALGWQPCEDVLGSAASWRRPRDALSAIALTEKWHGPEGSSREERSGGMLSRESQSDLSRRPTCRCGSGAQDPAASRGTLALPPCARRRPVGRARAPQRRVSARPPVREDAAAWQATRAAAAGAPPDRQAVSPHSASRAGCVPARDSRSPSCSAAPPAA